jgi:hypothetical protein
MSVLRRIFTAPGNPRVWISLAVYITALVAIVVYRDRIGQKAADVFQQLTETPVDAGISPEAGVRASPVAEALRRSPGERERALLRLSRAGAAEALEALERVLRAQPAAPAELLPEARAALVEGSRRLRAAAAGLLLVAERVRPDALSARAELRATRSKDREKRLRAVRRLGWLGLVGARSRTAEREVLRLARQSRDEGVRVEALRALGRIADPALETMFLRRIADKRSKRIHEAAVAALIDVGLAGEGRRSRILRALAARLADRKLAPAHAEDVWRALRWLAANGDRLTPIPAPR